MWVLDNDILESVTLNLKATCITSACSDLTLRKSTSFDVNCINLWGQGFFFNPLFHIDKITKIYLTMSSEHQHAPVSFTSQSISVPFLESENLWCLVLVLRRWTLQHVRGCDKWMKTPVINMMARSFSVESSNRAPLLGA